MRRSLPVPKVSIILPAYNAGRYIGEALDSIRGQSLREWELIVVDDGSTDDTASIVQAHAAENGRIRLIRSAHAGIVAALNRGVALARAAIIARMDSDDRSLPRRLELQVQLLEQAPELGVVSCKAHLFGETQQSGGLQRYLDWVNDMEGPEQIASGRFVDAPVLHPAVCFRRDLLKRHGTYREGNFPEDYELWLRWLEAGVRFSQVPEFLFEWRDHAHKLTRTHERYREQTLWQLKGQHLHQWCCTHLEHGRELWIWGAGRRTRSRLQYLSSLQQVFPLCAYIDVDPRKIGQRIEGIPVLAPDALTANPNAFVLGMVGSVGARDLIRSMLESTGRREGEDFLFLA